MAYFSPFVDAAGFHIPTYNDILADDVEQFLAIYPANSDQGIDSTDYQALANRALKTYDTFQAAQLAYNQRSPATAVGSGLDAVVKYSGIARKQPSFSSVVLTVGGTPGAELVDCIASDQNGVQWILPSLVTIPTGGSVNVTAQAVNAGAVTGGAGTITVRATPRAGWLSVTNPSDAAVGLPVESDSQLRARFYLSTALPSRSLLAGTIAAVAALSGVSRYNILENFTGAVDANGNPPHSINAVVEGGLDESIAQAIYDNRGIGVYPNGTTAITIIDPKNNNLSYTVRFFRPTSIPIYVTITVHGLNLSFTTATVAAIKDALVVYLNSLQIGESLTVSSLYGAALSVMPNLSLPQFSIHGLIAGTSSGGQGGSDIAIAFNQVVTGISANVSVVVV